MVDIAFGVTRRIFLAPPDRDSPKKKGDRTTNHFFCGRTPRWSVPGDKLLETSLYLSYLGSWLPSVYIPPSETFPFRSPPPPPPPLPSPAVPPPPPNFSMSGPLLPLSRKEASFLKHVEEAQSAELASLKQQQQQQFTVQQQALQSLQQQHLAELRTVLAARLIESQQNSASNSVAVTPRGERMAGGTREWRANEVLDVKLSAVKAQQEMKKCVATPRSRVRP